VAIVLLVVSIFRGGGGKRRGGGSAAAPPRPIIAGGSPMPGAMPYTPAPSPAGGGGGGGGDFMYGGGPPAAGPSNVNRATLTGSAGIFTVVPGMEMRAGRDGAACQILLSEPRVSGTHASVKIDSGQLMVRDESSNNGTYVNGQKIPGGVWTPVPPGAALRFGPVEFSVRLE
jgi:hypothetical protein